MLESLFNKVAGLQDCCKAYLLHTLLRFYFSLGKTLKKFIQRGIFRTKLSIYSGAFFTLVKSYFKNVLNSIELPFGSIFYTTHPFRKKLATVKTSGKKVLTMELFFFSKFVESVKTTCVCIVFFFHYFKYYGQNIFSRITVLYLIAKVERKE